MSRTIAVWDIQPKPYHNLCEVSNIVVWGSNPNRKKIITPAAEIKIAIPIEMAIKDSATPKLLTVQQA